MLMSGPFSDILPVCNNDVGSYNRLHATYKHPDILANGIQAMGGGKSM